MNKKDLVSRVAAELRVSGVRKPVDGHKAVFHISDDEGNQSDFVIKKPGKMVQYTTKDVDNVVEALLKVIEDALKVGESITILGFGTLALRYRKARRAKHPVTGRPTVVEGRHIPKFTFGKRLSVCADIFEQSLKEGTLRLADTDDTYEFISVDDLSEYGYVAEEFEGGDDDGTSDDSDCE